MPQATGKRAGRQPEAGARFRSDAVAENVRAMRGARGLSQGDLAERMKAEKFDWRQATVSEIERGARNVTVDELLGLALILEATPADLLDPAGIHGRSS